MKLRIQIPSKSPFIVQIITIAHTIRDSKFVEEKLPENLVLPAVDDDVDAGVEDQQDGGDDGHHLTPCMPGGDFHCPFYRQVENLKHIGT